MLTELSSLPVPSAVVLDERVSPTCVRPRFGVPSFKERERQRNLEVMARENTRVVVGGGATGYRSAQEVFGWVIGRFVDEIEVLERRRGEVRLREEQEATSKK